MRGGGDGIAGDVGHGTVATRTGQRDLKDIGRSHHRAGARGKRSARQRRKVVVAVDLVEGEAVEQALFEHPVGTAAAFFRRLKD